MKSEEEDIQHDVGRPHEQYSDLGLSDYPRAPLMPETQKNAVRSHNRNIGIALVPRLEAQTVAKIQWREMAPGGYHLQLSTEHYTTPPI